jgi:hypothetical protein
MSKLKMYDERMAICRACPELKRKLVGSFCNICGCNMKMKAQMKSQDCPLGKWPKIK